MHRPMLGRAIKAQIEAAKQVLIRAAKDPPTQMPSGRQIPNEAGFARTNASNSRMSLVQQANPSKIAASKRPMGQRKKRITKGRVQENSKANFLTRKGENDNEHEKKSSW